MKILFLLILTTLHISAQNASVWAVIGTNNSYDGKHFSKIVADGPNRFIFYRSNGAVIIGLGPKGPIYWHPGMPLKSNLSQSGLNFLLGIK